MWDLIDDVEFERNIALVHLILDTQPGFTNNIKEFFSADSTGQVTERPPWPYNECLFFQNIKVSHFYVVM